MYHPVPMLVKGLITAIQECLNGSSWQRRKVHFMRNILAHVSQKEDIFGL
jgi:transposase-like protein